MSAPPTKADRDQLLATLENVSDALRCMACAEDPHCVVHDIDGVRPGEQMDRAIENVRVTFAALALAETQLRLVSEEALGVYARQMARAGAETTRLRAALDAARAVAEAFSPDEPLRLIASGNDAADRIVALRAALSVLESKP